MRFSICNRKKRRFRWGLSLCKYTLISLDPPTKASWRSAP
jgi:hypothetical protein